jgi:putative Ca2+/H+ antiporter (TMEM165/GDT1 family)
MSDLVSALVIVFVAELGDKTQLVALGFGARYRLSLVITGIGLAYVGAGVVSVVAGALIGAALPTRFVSFAGGLLFIGFAIWTLAGSDAPAAATDDLVAAPQRTSMGAVASVAVAMFVAEFGDKTMLATATLASRNNPIAVFVGATVGIFLAGVLGAVIGRAVGHRLPDRTVRTGAALVFAVFGVALVVSAF